MIRDFEEESGPELGMRTAYLSLRRISMRQRLYINGRLSKSTSGDPSRLRKWLDNMEREWTKRPMAPLVGPGEFDPNQAHSVERVSVDELIIITTGGKTIRAVNVGEKWEQHTT